MEDSPATTSPPEHHQTPAITPSERIRELNNIDQDVISILRSAGSAIDVLTGRHEKSTESDSDTKMSTDQSGDLQIENAKQDFGSHTRDFLTAVQSVTVRLRRQAYALEEARVIAAEPRDFDTAPVAGPGAGPGAAAAGRQGKGDGGGQVTNGGLGKLDVGYLNSRRDDVGKRKEAELWNEARQRLESMAGIEGAEEKPSDDVEMDDGTTT
ncbi:MAG: hypothetical protein M1831_006438 [Alyxoria varia]|nr:MAG: hypothetical protein M1831_006438 [Alyxoria varia]